MGRRRAATTDAATEAEAPAAEFGAHITRRPDEKPVADAQTIAKAARAIMDRQRVVASAVSMVGVEYATWERLGVSKELIRETIADINKDRSQAEEVSRHAERTRYKIAVGLIPVANAEWARAVKQADLGLDAVAAAGEVAEHIRHVRAFNRGHIAGKKGKPLNSNPFSAHPGSIEFVGWRDGWEDGNKLRKLMKPEKANTVQADDSRERVEPDDDDDPIGATAGSA